MKPRRFPDPFALTTDPRSYVPRASSERALREMEDELTEGRTAVLLAGPPGIGKTLMLHVLAERLEASFLPVYVPHGRLGAEDLSAFLLGTLGAPPAADPLAALMGLARSREQHRGEGGVRPLIALVDDVGGEGIEAIERLAAEARGLRLVAVPASDEDAGLLRRKLADSARLVSLREPLTGAESSALVRRRLVHAGLPGSVIGRYDEAAIQELHVAADGNPMALHALADGWLRRRARPARPKAGEAAPEPAPTRLGPREIARATHPPRPATAATPRVIRERPAVVPPSASEERPAVVLPSAAEERPAVVLPSAAEERPAVVLPSAAEERPAVVPPRVIEQGPVIHPPSERSAAEGMAPPRSVRVLPTARVERLQPPRDAAEPAVEAPPKPRTEAPPHATEATRPKAPVSPEPRVSRASLGTELPLSRSPVAPIPPARSGASVAPEPTKSATPITSGLPRVTPPARRRPFEPKIRLRPRGGEPSAHKPVAAFSAGLAAVLGLALWLLVGGPSELPSAERSIDVAAAPPPAVAAPAPSGPAPAVAAPEPPAPAPAPAVAAPEPPAPAPAPLPRTASSKPKTDTVPAARAAATADLEPAVTPETIAPPPVSARQPAPARARQARPAPGVASSSVAPAASTTRGVAVPSAVKEPEAALRTASGPEAAGRAPERSGSPLDVDTPRAAAATHAALEPVASAPEAAPGTTAPPLKDELVSVLPEAEVVPAPPARIRVHINATPWAEIELDGQPIGLTPLGNVEMTAGEHGFRAIFGDGSVVDRTLEIRSDARRVTFDRAEAAAPAADDD